MLQFIGSTIESIISIFVNTIGIVFAVGKGIGYALLCIGATLFDTFKFISHFAVFVYEEFKIFVQEVDAEYTHIVKVFHNRLINIVGDAIGAVRCVIGFLVWTFDVSKAFAYDIVHRWMELLAWSALATRSVCVLIGNSTWMLIMLIPNGILFVTKLLIQIIVNDVFGGISSMAVATVGCLKNTVHDTIDYFTVFPLHSLFGLLVIFLAIKYKHKTLQLFRFVQRHMTMLLMHLLRKIGNVFLGIFIALRFIYGIFSSALELRQHRRPSNSNLNGNRIENAEDVNCSPLNKSTGNSNLCVICQDRPKSIVLLPCRHLCLCRNCTYNLQSYRTVCPLCRERFCETIQVYV